MRFKRHEMNGGDWLAEQVARLWWDLAHLAYRTLRSVSDSEEAVQEASVHLGNTDATVGILGDWRRESLTASVETYSVAVASRASRRCPATPATISRSPI